MSRWDMWNSRSGYGLVAKGFHWLSAIVFVGMTVWGFVMAGYVFGEKYYAWYALHKQVGVIFLLGVIFRVINRYLGKGVRSPQVWQHYCLYVGLLVMPVSGWVMASAAGRAPVLGGVRLSIVPSGQVLVVRLAATCHFLLAIVMVVAIVWHVAELACQLRKGRRFIFRMGF